ncbi:Cerato-platanin-domain-containing protein [Penicillium chermesinum]|uniref:Cerato-platanin-domain-containing protein n=1 Tax=Penicillium chermesinum TaxID=63820 RepID=A0A9W9NRZ4_9EURO|nr:Cerato-platanin-domain-containing protein [Penicillium chermesinum]KAJ5223868.1 Cerato-platanin-domain-containing protein [Penicillium chermesinum]KAJ6155305.1 Cerato-platanin-domain-containing protein [Penicillium chermesinum]
MKSFTAISCTVLAALQVAAAAPSTLVSSVRPTSTTESSDSAKGAAAGTSVSISYDPVYSASLSMDQVKCSNGINGVKYATVGDLPNFPYVGGAPTISGTDTNCGKCYEVDYNGKSVYILAIDYSTGFNLNPDAFTALTGDLNLGRVEGTYTEVDGSFCKQP